MRASILPPPALINPGDYFLTEGSDIFSATDLTGTQIDTVHYLYALGGADRLIVNSENNSLSIIDGGDGADFLQIIDRKGAGAFDFPPDLLGGAGGDTLLGGHGGDHLRGYRGQDSLVGGAGQDYIDGGTGDDTMTGGAGADTFTFHTEYSGTTDNLVISGQTGRDIITDFDAKGAIHDRISLSDTGLTFADLSITRHAGGVVVDGRNVLHLVDGTDLIVRFHVQLLGVQLSDLDASDFG